MFSTKYQDEIMTNFDQVGLRGLLQKHPDDVFELDVSSPAVLADMDTPEDYQRELARFRVNRSKPPDPPASR